MKTEREEIKIFENEPTIMTTTGTIPMSELKAQNEANKKATERYYESLRKETRPKGTCPFKGNSMRSTCDKECAWFGEAECGVLSNSGLTNIQGKCPISHLKCNKDCALWNDNQCKILQKWCADNVSKTITPHEP